MSAESGQDVLRIPPTLFYSKVTAAGWLGVLGVLTILGADLLIFLAGWKPSVNTQVHSSIRKCVDFLKSVAVLSRPPWPSLRSILLLLLGGFLALCSASSLLLAIWLKTIGETLSPFSKAWALC